MKNFLLCFGLLVCSTATFSQNKRLDSLWRIYNNKAISDSSRLNALNDIAWQYTDNKPDSAILLAQEALTFSKEAGVRSEESKALNALAVSFSNKGEYPKSLEYYSMAVKLDEERGNKMGAGRVYGNIGNVYNVLSDYPRALTYYLKALKLSEETKDTRVTGNNNYNVGTIYLQQLNYEKALQYFEASLKIAEGLKDKKGMAINHLVIGLVFRQRGQYEKALEYVKLHLAENIELGDKRGIADAYSNLGEIYEMQEKYDEALDANYKAIQVRRDAQDTDGINKSYINFGFIYNKQKNYAMAIKYADSAIALAAQTGSIDAQLSAHSIYAYSYQNLGKYKEALEHHITFKQMTDSIFNIENSMQLSDLRSNYEIEKRENENKLLAQKNEIQALELNQNRLFIYGLCGLFLLGAAIALLLIRQNRLRNEQRESRLEQKLLRSQMNPHFIFNSLQAIQKFVLTKDTKDAARYLSSFANITRAVLENSRTELIPVKKEVTLLENYMQLQKLRFGDRFDYVIRLDPELDQENTLIPPMLSQPFIENALEHGMKDIDSGGLIEIYIACKDNTLQMEIKDNGKGISGSSETKEHQSLATTITKERIALMNRKQQAKVIFMIGEAFPDQQHKGVKVTFSIPMQHLAA